MGKVVAGGCYAESAVGNDQIASVRLGGLLSLGNAGRLSRLMWLDVGEQDAQGVLCDVTGSAVLLPPLQADYYGCIPYEQRLVPLALLVLPEQMTVYGNACEASARGGVIRRAFLSRQAAQAWLHREAEIWAEARANLIRQAHRVSFDRPAGTRANQPDPARQAAQRSSARRS